MRYFAKRIGILALTLWTTVTINFLIPRLMPGNPAESLIAKYKGQGPISPYQLHAIEIMLGLTNQNLFQQYLEYWHDILTLHFGLSYSYFPSSVAHMIGEALPWTLGLIGITTIVSFVLGTLLGIASAWRRGSALDVSSTSIFTFTSSFPYFWFALVVVYFLAFQWQLFPISGGSNGAITPSFSWPFISSALDHSILPGFTILVSSIGGWLLGMRNNMISVLSEDYITLAQARGLSDRRIALQYAARNAILPNLTGFAISIGFVVSGSVTTEIVFLYPGIGNMLYTAISNEDYPLMQAIFLVIVVCVIFANLGADVLNVLIDPRIRRGRAAT
jgi:peptide/nickel transport system permease protein